MSFCNLAVATTAWTHGKVNGRLQTQDGSDTAPISKARRRKGRLASTAARQRTANHADSRKHQPNTSFSFGRLRRTTGTFMMRLRCISVRCLLWMYDVSMQTLDESSLVGKMVIDLSDPNRPRFTLGELRQVLTERNELKTKLIEVEEELQGFKPISGLVVSLD